MKRIIAAAALMLSASVSAVTITDNYVGADNHGHGDVIGSSSLFNIFDMEVTRVGTLLTVTVNTVFKQGNGLGSFSSYTNTPNGQLKGIGFGDLFLSSTGWNPAGTAPYATDDHSNGTVWDYGISLQDRWNGTSTAASLYALNATTGNPDALLSEDFLSGATYRNGQEVAVNTATASFVKELTTDVSTANGQVTFLLDISGTSLFSSGPIGLHWALTCGNDVIEGEYWGVPEPSSITLMLFGLVAVGYISIRRPVPQTLISA